MKKIIKYILLLLAVALVGYKSVYFKKLSEVKGAVTGEFDPMAFAQNLWEEKLPARLDSAVGLPVLIKEIERSPADAFARYAHAMGIGNNRYSLVKLTGVAAVINEDDIIMQADHADSLMTVKLATEYVYGNAIRDASGLLDIRDFASTSDLNNVSEKLNLLVRSSVLPDFKQTVKQGDTIEVTGAVEFNKEHINFREIEIIPVRIKFVH